MDIDDIFVGSRGTRMVADDVHNLVSAQGLWISFTYSSYMVFYSESLRRRIANFTFMLGFSGSYMEHGDDREDEADWLLLG